MFFRCRPQTTRARQPVVNGALWCMSVLILCQDAAGFHGSWLPFTFGKQTVLESKADSVGSSLTRLSRASPFRLRDGVQSLSACYVPDGRNQDDTMPRSGARRPNDLDRKPKTGAYKITGGISPGIPSSAITGSVTNDTAHVPERQNSPADAWVKVFMETRNSLTKVKLIGQIASMVPKGDPLVLDFLCGKILDSKETINVRQAALNAIQFVGIRGQKKLVDTLIQCAENDTAHDVRRKAMQMLSKLAAQGDRDVMEIALKHLRINDLRGQPNFKPNGDPRALTEEAIHVLASVAGRGNVEAWSLLIRRVIDDSVLAVRIAAVQGLEKVADGDMIVDGGARGTVQVLALALNDNSQAVREAAMCTLKSLAASEGGVYYG